MKFSRTPIMLAALLAALAFLFWPSSPEEKMTPQSGDREHSSITDNQMANAVEVTGDELARVVNDDLLLLRVVDEAGFVKENAQFYWIDGDGANHVFSPNGTTQISRQGGPMECMAMAEGRWSKVISLNDAERESDEEVILELDQNGATVKIHLEVPFGEIPKWQVQANWSKKLSGEDWMRSRRGNIFTKSELSNLTAVAGTSFLEFENLPPGTWSFDISAQGYPSQVISATLEENSSHDLFAKLEVGGIVSAQLFSQDGNAIENVEGILLPAAMENLLEILPSQELKGIAEQQSISTSDENGEIKMGPVVAGEYIAAFAHPDFQKHRSPSFSLSSGQSKQLGVIKLSFGQSIKILVRNEVDKKPLANAKVEWFSGNDFQQMALQSLVPWRPAETLSNELGWTNLSNLPPTDISVRAFLDGFAWSTISLTQENFDHGEAVIELSPAQKLNGKVVERDTFQPLAGIKVKAYPPARDLFGGLTAGKGNSPAEPTTTTDENGNFTLDGLSSGQWRISADGEEWAAAIKDIEIIPGLLIPEIELQLHRGASLLVQYLNDQGQAEEKSLITAFKFSGENSSTTDAIHTDEKGQAMFEHLVSGKYQVQAFPPGAEMQLAGAAMGDLGGLQMKSAFIDIKAEGLHEVTLGGLVLRSDIEGFIYCGDEPCTTATVMLNSINGMHTTTTDETGFYELASVAEGDYMMMVGEFGIGNGSGWYSTLSVAGAGVIEKNIDLPVTEIHIQVVSAENGQALSQIPVLLRPMNGTPGGGYKSTDQNGEVVFRYPQPGNYAVSVGHAAMPLFGSGQKFETKLIENFVVIENQIHEVMVSLESAAEVPVLVMDSNGNPVGGAGVFGLAENGQPLSQWTMSTTDLDGRMVIKSLPPGEMQLIARHPQLGEKTVDVSLSSGANPEVAITLEAGCVVKVLVTDENGETIPGVMAVAQNQQGVPISTLLYGNQAIEYSMNMMTGGEQRLGPLSPGKYTLLLSSLSGDNMSQPLVIDSGIPEIRIAVEFKPKQ